MPLPWVLLVINAEGHGGDGARPARKTRHDAPTRWVKVACLFSCGGQQRAEGSTNVVGPIGCDVADGQCARQRSAVTSAAATRSAVARAGAGGGV